MAAKVKPRVLEKNKAESNPRCGLCGKTKKLTKTECCDQWICDDEDKYVIFSYARNSCSSKALDLYRDTGTNQHRYAALGIRKETVVHSDRSRFPFLGSKKKKNYSNRELWIGEARRIPVNKPEKVYNALDGIYGRSMRKMASDRGVDPDSIPHLASPSEVTPARALRELLKKTSLVQSIMASVYLGPAAWVLVVPLQKVGRHIEDIVVLTGEISRVIDRHAGREALGRVPNEDENR